MREKHLGKQASAEAQGDDVGDIIIADDYCSIKSTNGVSWKALLLTGLLGTGFLAGAALVAWLLLRDVKKDVVMQPAARSREFWEIQEKQLPDGTWKETGRRKLRAAVDGSMMEVKEP